MTETALERASPTPLARPSRLAQVSGFTDQQIALVSQTVARGASRLGIAWLLYNAGRLGADPVLGEIYLVTYDKSTLGQIVPGIGLYRKQAEASGVYAGSDLPEFEYDASAKVPKGGPSYARVTVYKMLDGVRCPFVGEARWVEDYPGDSPAGEQYRKRPWNQLAVRAESRALRKGFPRQTQTLEAQQPVPQAWQDAAQADDARQSDPEVIEANARLYDEIFGSEDAPLASATRARAPRPPRRARGAASAAAEDASSTPSSAQLERNRQLVAQAQELGVAGLSPASEGKGIEEINAELAERIRIAESKLVDQRDQETML